MSIAPIAWNHVERLTLKHMYVFEKYLEYCVQKHMAGLNPILWGFEHLTLNLSRLNEGCIGLTNATGIMPDGTIFIAPEQDILPSSISITPDLLEDNKQVTVYLALMLTPDLTSPERHYKSERFALDKIKIDQESIAVTRPRLILVAGKHRLENYTYLAVANVIQVRSDGSLVLDPHFITPTFSIQNNQELMLKLKELYSLIKQKIRQLSELCSASSHANTQLSTSYIDAAMLEIYNNFDVYLQRVLNSTSMHPSDVYYKLTEFYGKLATYLDKNCMVKEIKVYDHYNIADSFLDMLSEFKQQLMTPVERAAIQVMLKQDHLNAYCTNELQPNVLYNVYFILIVSAHIPTEHIRKYFPGQCKVAAASQIENHIRSLSTGVSLSALRAVPQHVPYFHEAVYFEIPQAPEFHDAWQVINSEGSISFHVTGDYPGLKLQLWLIKKDKIKV